VVLTDRAKDVIKSGGEWISSIEIENIAAGHPKALLAAAPGVTLTVRKPWSRSS